MWFWSIAGIWVCLLGSTPGTQTVEERIAGRSFPSVFQAWSPADNLPRANPMDVLARHDLVWQGASSFRLAWEVKPEGLAESFTPASIVAGRAYRQELLARNPNLILLLEVRYRDAWDGFLPADSPWWMRDDAGRRRPGWEEGGFFLLNYPNAAFQAHVAAQCKAAAASGVVDGVLLDWWTDDDDRLRLIQAVRSAIGYAPLVVVNANDHTIPRTADYVNGLFMEVTATRTAADWQRVAQTLLWAETHLRTPRVNCLETWFHDSREDLHLMRATTTLSLTHSNGYCLFSDPNPLPTPDHLHNWYSFWDKKLEDGRLKLGQPLGVRVVRSDGVVTRAFQRGTVAYNPKGNGPATLSFAEPMQSITTASIATEHKLGDEDGDIYVPVHPAR
jgi:hypothetical protein